MPITYFCLPKATIALTLSFAFNSIADFGLSFPNAFISVFPIRVQSWWYGSCADNIFHPSSPLLILDLFIGALLISPCVLAGTLHSF